MNKVIIYKTENNSVAIIIPAPDCRLSLEEIALKDVPAGCVYKIVDAKEIPADRTFRNAWEWQD